MKQMKELLFFCIVERNKSMLEIYTTDEQCFSFSPKDLFSNITVSKTNISITLLKTIKAKKLFFYPYQIYKLILTIDTYTLSCEKIKSQTERYETDEYYSFKIYF